MSDDATLQAQVDALKLQLNDVASGADEMWHLVAAIFVFFMQAGFAMLEAGNVQSKNALNILFKNMCDACISALGYWLIGYGIAYGASKNGFIGTKGGYALSDDAFNPDGPNIDDEESRNLYYHNWFFQWVFVSTAATIVSGSVSERCKIDAYFIYSFFISTFIYPIITCWCWGDGWLSPFPEQKYLAGDFIFGGMRSNNFVDFAGSGVVHMVGGISGLVGAMVLGPRIGRFNADGTANSLRGHNMTIGLLGTLILWIGWYGFNAGSTLCIVGSCAKIASKVAVTTTIGAAASGAAMITYQRFFCDHYELGDVGNAILAGLVSITGSCAVIDPWAAFIIGIIGCGTFVSGSRALTYFQIDDPLDAAPIHGLCGAWGVLAVGIFGTDKNAAYVGYLASAAGENPFTRGQQFAVQLAGLFSILGWTLVTSGILFLGIDYTIGMRVDRDTENTGLDESEHGGSAYNPGDVGDSEGSPMASSLGDVTLHVQKVKEGQ